MLGDQAIRRKKTSLFCLYIGGCTTQKKGFREPRKKKPKTIFPTFFSLTHTRQHTSISKTRKNHKNNLLRMVYLYQLPNNNNKTCNSHSPQPFFQVKTHTKTP
jgi:hypothetical protein